MNHYESFNDPFECRCGILEGFPPKDPSSSRFKNIIAAWGFDDVNDQIALENYDDYVFSLEGTEPNIPLIIDNTRICCFSKNGNNPLMWSHYADGLRGFCVEFDRNMVLSKDPTTAQIFEVLYQDTPLIIDTAVIAVLWDQIDYHDDAIYAAEQEIKHLGTDRKTEVEMYKEYLGEVLKKDKGIYQKMLATKPTQFACEEEIRIISPATNQGKSGEFLHYPPQAIKSLIVGEKMPDRQIQALRKVIELTSSTTTLKKAMRIDGSFSIVVSDGI